MHETVTSTEGQPSPSPKMRLWLHLVLLVAVSVLPVLLLTGGLVMFLAQEQVKHVESGLRSTTRALTIALEERAWAIASNLAIFAAAEEVPKERLDDLYEKLMKVYRSQEGLDHLSIALPDGKQLANTARPLGQELPSLGDQEFFRTAVRTKTPAFSGFRVAKTSNREVVTVAFPILKEGEVKYVLSASLGIRFITQLLLTQKIPEDWTAAVLDSNGIIIGRSKGADQFLGKPATPHLSARIKEVPESVFQDVTKEGHPAYGSFARSEVTKWTVVLGLPAESVLLPIRRVLTIILTGGVTLLVVGLLLAAYLAQRIARPISELASAASAIGKEREFKPIASSVVEVAEVAQALVEASKERNRSDQVAQEAIQLRDNFLSVASHELKTPLTALRLHSQVLQRRLRGAEVASVVQEPLRQISYQIDRLAKLIDELLDVSRISSGKIDLVPERLNLAKLLSEVTQQYEGEIASTGSTLTVNIPSEINGVWDRSRLEQVITNLLSNAFKYGAGKPIYVSAKQEEDFAFVTVQDSGIGIAAKDQKRIFQRFERAVSNQNYGGLGLGLWIVWRIVESLGGDITVTSSPDSGSSFTVKLPLQLERREMALHESTHNEKLPPEPIG